MKGRTIFGSLVKYDQVWRTGSDTATRISFSTPVRVNGVALDAGTYELFTIPRKNADWTVIFHKNMSQWGSYSYDAKNDVARLQVKPAPLGWSESFAINFHDLKPAAASMNLLWEKTLVSMTIGATSARRSCPASRPRCGPRAASRRDWSYRSPVTR